MILESQGMGYKLGLIEQATQRYSGELQVQGQPCQVRENWPQKIERLWIKLERDRALYRKKKKIEGWIVGPLWASSLLHLLSSL